MARTTTTGNSARPTEAVTVRKIVGGAGPGPSMNVPGDGGVRRALLPRDRRDAVDEHSRGSRSARHHADAMQGIGGAADNHGNDE